MNLNHLWNLLDAVEGAFDKVFDKLPYDKLVPLDVRGRWAGVATVPVLVLVAFFFLLIKGIYAETATLEKDLENARREVKLGHQIEKNLPALEKQVVSLNYQMDLMRLQLPDEKEIPDLLDQLSNLGVQSGLSFQVFRPLQEQEEDFYARVPVEIMTVGSFHNTLAFLDRVSRMPRIVTISNLDISIFTGDAPNIAGGPLVRTRCMAVTYRFLEKKVDEGG